MPQIRIDQLWISSVPTGQNVYFAEDTTKIKDAKEKGWVHLYNKKNNKHYIMNRNFLKGKTPILIKNIKAGNYLIGIEPVDFITVKEPKQQFGFPEISWHNLDPSLTIAAFVTPIALGSMTDVENYKKGIYKNGAIIYNYTKTDTSNCIIILTSTDSLITYSETASLYPKGNNYLLDDIKLKNDLMSKVMFAGNYEPQIPTILSLLHRGGKVIAGDNATRFIIELIGPNKWSIATEIKVAH